MADIELYIDSKYAGFHRIEKIDSMYREYEQAAEEIVPTLDDDEIVLYGIFRFAPDSERFISADFMTLRMPYTTYLETYSKMIPGCRMFFKRKRKRQTE